MVTSVARWSKMSMKLAQPFACFVLVGDNFSETRRVESVRHFSASAEPGAIGFSAPPSFSFDTYECHCLPDVCLCRTLTRTPARRINKASS